MGEAGSGSDKESELEEADEGREYICLFPREVIKEENDAMNVGDMLACSDISAIATEDDFGGAATSTEIIGFDTATGLVADERARALIEMYGGRTDVAREDIVFYVVSGEEAG